MAGLQRESMNKKETMPVKTIHMANIDYKDTVTLKRFISEHDRTHARRVAGLSVQDQHRIAFAVKNAREVALLPYASIVR